MTLKMTTAQVVETSVTVTNSSFQNYTHPDDHTTRITIIIIIITLTVTLTMTVVADLRESKTNIFRNRVKLSLLLPIGSLVTSVLFKP